jgi:hypothetical protein
LQATAPLRLAIGRRDRVPTFGFEVKVYAFGFAGKSLTQTFIIEADTGKANRDYDQMLGPSSFGSYSHITVTEAAEISMANWLVTKPLGEGLMILDVVSHTPILQILASRDRAMIESFAEAKKMGPKTWLALQRQGTG